MRGSLTVVFVFGLMALLPDSARAQSTQDQSDPALVSLMSGAVVTWTEDRGVGSRIYARRIRENGLVEGAGSASEWELVPEGATGDPHADQRWAHVVEGFVLWSERAPGAMDYDLYLQKIDEYARPTGRPLLVAGGPGDQAQGQIGAECGELLIVWADDRYDDGDIFARWINDRALQPHGDEFVLVRSPGHADQPAIDTVTDSSDHLIKLYFTDDRAGNQDIYVTTLLDNYRIAPPDPESNHQPVIATSADEHDPAVVGPLGSRGALVWSVDDVAGGTDVLMQRFSDNQRLRGAPVKIAGGAGSQGAPTVMRWLPSDGRHLFMVGWEDDAAGSRDILGARVLSSGRVEASRVLAAD